MPDIDAMFDQLNEMFLEINGHMARTGGQLLDWAISQSLITDEQRDLYYNLGGF